MTTSPSQPADRGRPAVVPRTPAAEIRVEIRSSPLYLAGVRDLLGSVAKRLGFSEEAGSQIALAVDEALCNVIRHGYGKANDRPIWISLWPEGGAWSGGRPAHDAVAGELYPDSLRIVIEDEANQVDPAKIRSRDLDEIRPGGLGVHIIRSVMDEAVYERRDSIGMRLIMVKKRFGTGSEPSETRSCCPGRSGQLRTEC